MGYKTAIFASIKKVNTSSIKKTGNFTCFFISGNFYLYYLSFF